MLLRKRPFNWYPI